MLELENSSFLFLNTTQILYSGIRAAQNINSKSWIMSFWKNFLKEIISWLNSFLSKNMI